MEEFMHWKEDEEEGCTLVTFEDNKHTTPKNPQVCTCTVHVARNNKVCISGATIL